MKSPRLNLSTNQVLLAAALFLTAFANLAFFRNLAAAFAETPWGLLHMLSLAVVLMCATVLFLALVSFRPVLKPVLFVLFLVASLSAKPRRRASARASASCRPSASPSRSSGWLGRPPVNPRSLGVCTSPTPK